MIVPVSACTTGCNVGYTIEVESAVPLRVALEVDASITGPAQRWGEAPPPGVLASVVVE